MEAMNKLFLSQWDSAISCEEDSSGNVNDARLLFMAHTWDIKSMKLDHNLIESAPIREGFLTRDKK
jgi:hypothetical protein